MRLRIGEERHAGAGAVVPERPAPLRERLPDGGERRRDELDQVPLQDVAGRLGGSEPLEGDGAAEAVERQEETAAVEHRAEQDRQREGEDGEHPRRHPVVPAAERRGERDAEHPHPEGGQQVHRTPVGHGAE